MSPFQLIPASFLLFGPMSLNLSAQNFPCATGDSMAF